MASDSQIADTILMIRPVKFGFNEETASNNYYQKKPYGLSQEEIQQKAASEFDAFTGILKDKGINVIIVEDTFDPHTPDSIFPNNWVSFHPNGTAILYPMYSELRRSERRRDIFKKLEVDNKLKITSIEDLSTHEKEGRFLEGTGSMVLDHPNKIAYAVLSERTDEIVLDEFCDKMGYHAVKFSAFQTVRDQRLRIYHTNVMMCVGDEFAVVCTHSIDDEQERQVVIGTLEKHGKEVISISEAQCEQFAGNMLQVKAVDRQKFVVMSSSAFKSLSSDQKKRLSKYGELLHSPLTTIETLGGGSARCMMAEVFLPDSH